MLALWMGILGLGIGPTLAVFTIVIQNVVPMAQLGTATSSLAFFRQIGGSVGLAVAGAFFGSRIVTNVSEEVATAGVPPQFADLVGGGSFDRNSLGAGVDLGASLSAAIESAPIPDALKEQALALVPAIVDAIHQAMAITIGEVFWLGVGSMVLAFFAALLIPEIPLRSHASDREEGFVAAPIAEGP
jgi:hypothetical protein